MNKSIENNIYLKQKFSTKEQVMKAVGNLMLKKGVADFKYVNSFEERNKLVSVAIGNYLALVHGTYETSVNLKDNFICFLELEKIIDWDANPVKFIIGMAVRNDSQNDIIQNIAINFSDEDVIEKLLKNTTKEEVLKLLKSV